MREISRIPVCLCAMLSISGVALAQSTQSAPTSRPASQPRPDMTPVTAADARVLADQAYVTGGGPLQKLDVYAPKGASAAPIVVFVHGGEWDHGDKREVSAKPRFFNEHGVVFVSVNYRLSGTDKHPAQVDDVASAVKWIKQHAREWGGDPGAIFLMGHSAGCHIVTLTALDPRILARASLTPADLRGVVSWSGGAFDLVDKVAEGGMYAGYIRINFGTEEATWRDASPLNHVGNSRSLPRFLFASSELGKAASRTASEKMATRIREAGGKAETAMLIGRDHTGANHELGQVGDETGQILLRFIRSTMEGKG